MYVLETLGSWLEKVFRMDLKMLFSFEILIFVGFPLLYGLFYMVNNFFYQVSEEIASR